MIVTFAGCYLRRIGGWIAVADLIDCLGAAGVAEPAVRQALVRLKSRGFLDAERRGGVAGYALTPAGHADLAPGDRRIFRFGQADPADGWVLAVFSVPEDRRHHRYQLRSQLGWLGFGTVGPGVWVAPAPLEQPARDLLAAGRLDEYVTWFRAGTVDPPDVARWWDLAALRAQHEKFRATWQSRAAGRDAVAGDPVAGRDAAAGDPVAGRDVAAGDPERGPARTAGRGPEVGQNPVAGQIPVGVTGSAAFAGYLHLVDDWRLLPRIDPGLPAALLPADWPGPEAWRVFATLRERWEQPGLDYLEDLVAR